MVILNYPGSKRRLLDYILKSTEDYIDKDKYVLDIFSGTGCVAEMFAKNGYDVIVNDVERYASNISSALLQKQKSIDLEQFKKDYVKNSTVLLKTFKNEVEHENSLIKNEDDNIINFDLNLPKVYDSNCNVKIGKYNIHRIEELQDLKDKIPSCLFTLYYAGIYFGLFQSIQIDSIRYAIENVINNQETLYACLYFAMKEASFSKDGHMAQPMSQEKNKKRLFKVRRVDILTMFLEKYNEFINEKKEDVNYEAYCEPLQTLLNEEKLFNKVGFIYADPPYTDMQYSRYFHLLNTVTSYEYPKMTNKFGKLTTGLYADNRYQSPLSNHGTAANQIESLIEKASKHNVSLCFSYAYPVNTKKQATDRYTMSIDELENAMRRHYKKVKICKEAFNHCNNRNSKPKEVYEYLIIGVGK